MRIDAHQHFWRYSPVEYPWIASEWPIRRDFLPGDLQPLLKAAGLDGTVAVQARQTLEESRWLLELAEAFPFIKGVVGWVDLRSDDAEQQLVELARWPKFRGARHVVQDEPDDNFMLGEAFQRGIAMLRGFGLSYDILIYPRQLPAAIKLARAFPEQPFVLDHAAKPDLKSRDLRAWTDGITHLARCENVYCKVSGLITEAHWRTWRPEDFTSCLDTLLQAFGPDRLMFGSDWPVALLSGEYSQVLGLARDFSRSSGDDFEAKLFGLNAARFYNL